MTIVTRFYPNGEFTHGVDTSHRRHRNPPPQTSTPHELIPVGDSVCLQGGDVCGEVFLKTADIQPGQELVNVHGDKYTYLCADMGKHIYAFETADGSFVSVTTLSDKLINYVRRGELTPLGLSSAIVLKKNAKTRTRKGTMSRRMARHIRNTAHILQRKYGHSNLSFLTLTLPDLSTDELHKCSMNWGTMVHKFLVWLRYRAKKKNMALEYVYCTEVQTKRLEKRHEYALHLHIVFRGRYAKGKAWAVTPVQCRKEWIRCIKSVLGHGNFKRDSLENLQQVRKSAAGYLAKYLSKCCVPLHTEDEEYTHGNPQINWGGYSRNLIREFNEELVTVRSDGKRGDFARSFIRAIPELLKSGIVAYYKEGLIPLFTTNDARDTRYLKVGVGRLTLPEPRSYLESLEAIIVNNYYKGLDIEPRN